MNKNTRTYKSLKNAKYGVIVQILNVIISFASRTIFIKVLSSEYLGINGIFSNVLSVLSLAELGFGQAIIFSMYKPIAEKDEKKISALMSFYRKVYDVVALLIFIIGISMVPILKYIIKSDISINLLNVYYILFLISTIVSYLFSYKTAILTADQKEYKLKEYGILCKLVQFLFQTVVLIKTHNYIYYLVTQISITLIFNTLIALRVNELYPFLKTNNTLGKSEKKSIYSQVTALFLQKISAVMITNTDNILISMLVNISSVGYYSNYSLLITAVNSFLSIVLYSTSASVGNLNTEKKANKTYSAFKKLYFLSDTVYGISSLIFFFIMNDFIKIWIGETYILDISIVAVIVINFYICGILTPSWIFRDGAGLFKYSKYASFIAALINIVLSIILGKIMGLFGILLATVICRLVTTYWHTPYILYKKVFYKNITEYYLLHFRFLFSHMVSFILIYSIVCNISNISILNIIFKSIITVVISTIVLSIVFINTSEGRIILNKIKLFFHYIKKSI